MNAYIELTLVALVTIYIVDVSGFTDSWRGAISRWLKVSNLRPLPPFDCGKCMSWWVCLIYAICTGEITLGTVAYSALLSLLSFPIAQILIFIRESLLWLINKIMP